MTQEKETWEERFDGRFRPTDIGDYTIAPIPHIKSFIYQEIQKAREEKDKEWRDILKQRIEIAEVCIEASERGQDLGGGFTPREEIESETSIKIALETLLK